jgi:hypothetical protein
MISSEFKKEEYWLIKWPLFSLVFSLVLCGGLLFGLNTVDAAAASDLRRARSTLDEAREALDKIEEEEATIIEYIGRYRQMEQDGVVTAEDRLQFQERLLEIRDQFNLFPVGLNIQGQTALPLQYPEGRAERGREIVLNTSLVQLNLPMLHENDLANLLLSLMDGPGLLQPLSCSISSNNTDTTSFIYLARHFNAACTLNWYTFKLPPPEETE